MVNDMLESFLTPIAFMDYDNLPSWQSYKVMTGVIARCCGWLAVRTSISPNPLLFGTLLRRATAGGLTKNKEARSGSAQFIRFDSYNF